MPSIDYFRNAEATLSFIAGETIFDVGQHDTRMYAVKTGEVEIWFNGEVFETVGTGGFFGEKSLVDDSAHTTSAIARTDCTLIPVNEKMFLFLVHETPMFALHVMRTMAQRTRRIAELAMR